MMPLVSAMPYTAKTIIAVYVIDLCNLSSIIDSQLSGVLSTWLCFICIGMFIHWQGKPCLSDEYFIVICTDITHHAVVVCFRKQSVSSNCLDGNIQLWPHYL